MVKKPSIAELAARDCECDKPLALRRWPHPAPGYPLERCCAPCQARRWRASPKPGRYG